MTDWDQIEFVIELRGDPTGGAVWDDGEWDDAEWVDPADDDAYDWLDVTDDYVQAVFTSARRPQFGSQFTPGTATVMLRNVGGDYTPGTAGAVLEIGQGVRITAVQDVTETVKFRGVVGGVQVVESPGASPLVNVVLRSPLAAVASQNRTAVAAVGQSDQTGERIHRILDSVVWPTSLRSIDDGVEWMEPTTLVGAPLAELQLAAMSDGGEVFHDDAGNLVFLDRDAVDALAISTPIFTAAGYADPGGAGDWIPYAAMQYQFDADKVRNHVTIGSVDPDVGEYTKIDNASVDAYGLSVVKRTDLLNEHTTYLVAPYEQWPERLAERILAAWKDPVGRYTITLTGGDDGAVAAVLGSSILDVVRIRRYVGAVEVDESAQIEGITYTIRPARNDGAGSRTDTWSVVIVTGSAS